MTLNELIARVDAAEGPDRELDGQLWLRFGTTRVASVPQFTASFDAAHALAMQKLPGWSILLVWNGRDGVAQIHLSPVGVNQLWPEAGKGKTLPLTMLNAFLRAYKFNREMAEL